MLRNILFPIFSRKIEGDSARRVATTYPKKEIFHSQSFTAGTSHKQPNFLVRGRPVGKRILEILERFFKADFLRKLGKSVVNPWEHEIGCEMARHNKVVRLGKSVINLVLLCYCWHTVQTFVHLAAILAGRLRCWKIFHSFTALKTRREISYLQWHLLAAWGSDRSRLKSGGNASSWHFIYFLIKHECEMPSLDWVHNLN